MDILWISNHGGRQLDHAVGSLDVLPEVVEVAGGRAAIIVDGGFWRGTDILKAIARGASAVATGRMPPGRSAPAARRYSSRCSKITEFEIETTMKLLGVTSLAQLNTSFLRDVDASVCTGAFPLLGVVSTGERAPVL